MDEKKNPSFLNNEDEDELRNVMGPAFERIDATSQSPHNPKATSKPRRPSEPVQTPEGCTPPLFPLIRDDQVQEYIERNRDDRKPDEVLGNFQHGKVDPELNELALKAVAEERGISVEELLSQNPDKTLDKKLEFADMDQPTPPGPEPRKPAAAQVSMSLEEARRMVAEAARQAEQAQPRPEPPPIENSFEKPAPAPPRPKKKKLTPKKQHPLLQELRNEFSLDAIKPARLTVKGKTFEMVPPPSALHPWIMAKIANAEYVNSDQALKVAIRIAIISASLVRINGVSTAEIFGLTEETIPLEDMSPELRELLAQTTWEMIADITTIEGLFIFDPQLIIKLFDVYSQTFQDDRFVSDQDPDLIRYVCPIENCPETYRMKLNPLGYYCRVHGTKMENAGTVGEGQQIPLL